MADEDLKIDSGQVMVEFPAPELPYAPGTPKSYRPSIGLIGCGGIAPYHLEAYRDAGYSVVALCDLDEAKAKERRDAFYPDAAVFTDYGELLKQDGIEVVDVATHAETRAPMVEDALRAGKHVLSQKPYALDLDVGERLADLADEKGLRLAVNQNGRWAPHFSYIRHAIAAGVIGEVTSAHFRVHWDHRWTAGTPFDDIPHMILYDFSIHWFDILSCFMGERTALRAYASEAVAAGQVNKAAMLAQVMVAYEGAQASLVFDADALHGAVDATHVVGTKGTLTSSGPDLSHQEVTLYTAEGYAKPALESEWFKAGFWGTMAELLCAIEEGREPSNSGRNNLKSLALCFAAISSAETGTPKAPGEVRKLPGA